MTTIKQTPLSQKKNLKWIIKIFCLSISVLLSRKMIAAKTKRFKTETM